MEDLTFGEQVKIILSRKGMTIKELAELIQASTGKKMSRQNLTQRLGRDNFQEKDMRMIATILGCPFQLSIFPLENETGEKAEPMEELLLKYVKHPKPQPKKKKESMEDGFYQQVLVFDQDTPEAPAAEPDRREGASASSDPAPAAADGEDLLELEILDPEDSEDLDEMDLLYGGFKTKRIDRKAILAAAEKAEKEKWDAVTGTADTTEAQTAAGGGSVAEEQTAADSAGGGSGTEAQTAAEERDMTIGELYMIHKELDELEETIHPKKDADMPYASQEVPAAAAVPEPEPAAGQEEPEEKPEPEEFEPVIRYEDAEENLELGEMNPYTGREYQTNSVRMHPSRIGYVQVYDRFQHGWTDMTEWAFLGYQERKKTLLGRDYEPPIYLD